MKKEEQLYRIILSDNWGGNSDREVVWDEPSLNHCLDGDNLG